MAKIFDSSVFEVKHRNPLSRKQAWVTRVTGQKAVHLMLLLKPYMGERRTRQIEEAIKTHNPIYKGWSLSTEQRKQIAKRAASGDPINQIAREFGVGWELVKKIQRSQG